MTPPLSYDTRTVHPSVVESAWLTHPSMLSVSGPEANPTYRDPADYLFGDPQRIFCSSGCVRTWLERTGRAEGYVMDLTTLWRLASALMRWSAWHLHRSLAVGGAAIAAQCRGWSPFDHGHLHGGRHRSRPTERATAPQELARRRLGRQGVQFVELH